MLLPFAILIFDFQSLIFLIILILIFFSLPQHFHLYFILFYFCSIILEFLLAFYQIFIYLHHLVYFIYYSDHFSYFVFYLFNFASDLISLIFYSKKLLLLLYHSFLKILFLICSYSKFLISYYLSLVALTFLLNSLYLASIIGV